MEATGYNGKNGQPGPHRHTLLLIRCVCQEDPNRDAVCSIMVHSPNGCKDGCKDQSGAGVKPVARSFFQDSHMDAGAQGLVSVSTDIPGTLAEGQIKSETPGIQTGSHMGYVPTIPKHQT